jgi:hypothetical protein
LFGEGLRGLLSRDIGAVLVLPQCSLQKVCRRLDARRCQTSVGSSRVAAALAEGLSRLGHLLGGGIDAFASRLGFARLFAAHAGDFFGQFSRLFLQALLLIGQTLWILSGAVFRGLSG